MFLKRFFSLKMTAILMAFLALTSPAWGDPEKPQTELRAAVVNGAAISRAEFNGEVLGLQRTLLGMGQPLTSAQIVSLNTEVLESLIRRELLYQESRKTGIKIDQETIDREINLTKKQFLSETEYKNELNRRNLSEDQFRARLERNLAIDKYIEKQFSDKIKVTDTEKMAYYESHLYLLKQPLVVRVSHLLIQSDAKWDTARKDEARRKAERILKDLKSGKDFAVLAREYSDGPTRTNGGDLGYVRMGQLDKQFEGVIFNLKVGDMTDVIETDYGYHLFKVTDRKPESILAYDNVKAQIQQLLLQEKMKQLADNHARKLREKAKVEILLTEDIGSAKKP